MRLCIVAVEANLRNRHCLSGPSERARHIAARWGETRQRPQVRHSARIRILRRIAANALEVVALEIELARLVQALIRQVRVLALERVAERWKVAIVLPTRIGHYPVQVVEHARDEKVGVALRWR